MASYTKFADLTGDQDYTGVCQSLRFLGAGNTPSMDSRSLYGPKAISYAAAAQSYTVYRIDAAPISFAAAERDAAVPDGAVAAYSKVVSPSETDRFALRYLRIAGTPLEYARDARLTLGDFAIDSCIVGVPTLVSDVPPGTGVTFPQVAITGTAYDSRSGVSVAYDLTKSTATFRIDLATGRVYPNMHLIGSAVGLPDKDFGEYDGDGSVGLLDGVVTGTGFSGSFNPAPSAESPDFVGAPFTSFKGGFFGPQGREFVMLASVFRYRLLAPGTSANGLTADAVIYGRR